MEKSSEIFSEETYGRNRKIVQLQYKYTYIYMQETNIDIFHPCQINYYKRKVFFDF